MHAIKFLIKEHNVVSKKLKDLNKRQKFEKRQREFIKFADDLLNHEVMEHTLWYPRFRKYKDLNATIKHLKAEEKEAKKAITKLKKITDVATWEVEFKKFKKSVEHHAKQEEIEFFPAVMVLVDKQTLQEVGIELQDFRRKFKNQLKKAK